MSPSLQDLEGGGVAVVTGGAGGIGLACARSFGTRYPIVLADSSAERLAAAIADLRADGVDATGKVCDIADAADVGRLAASVEGQGSLAVLAHCAGLSPSMSDARTILAVNLAGTLHVLESFLPLAREGTVAICIASIAAHRGAVRDYDARLAAIDEPGSVERLAAGIDDPRIAYAVSKRGVVLQVERRAAAWAERGARIVALSPGLVGDTPMGRLEAPAGAKHLTSASALGRAARADEVAAVAELLASPAAGYVTGCDLRVDGGAVAGLRHHAAADVARHWDTAMG
jgi:NAD(P)-dependent dehydrogenase (short-subunit alcohol dehydrogenase family)